jgi:phosphopantetheine--protein transferase-like protein
MMSRGVFHSSDRSVSHNGLIPFALIRGLLPAFIAVAESQIDMIDGFLWPEEHEQIAGAVAQRQREFAAGRILARQALAALGGPQAPIPAGHDRVPIWPAGFCGSISHSGFYAAAALARSTDVASIGIDVERTERFRVDLERHILLPGEIARHLDGTDGQTRQANMAAIFSAKEAFYKAQYPLTRRRLTFHDAEVEIDLSTNTFEVRRTADATQQFAGRVAIADGFVAASLWFVPGQCLEP